MDHEEKLPDQTDPTGDDAEALSVPTTGDEDTTGEDVSEEPPPPPPPDKPVLETARIHSLDVLRGVAILGILLVNMWTFALPFPAALNPHLEGFDQGTDSIAYALVHMLAYSKTMPIFGMLFGAGIILFTQRVEARGGRSGRRWFARQWWLWLIGLAHGYLVWNGDILVAYAVVGLTLYRFRRFRVRTLVILAVIFMLIPKVGMFGLGEAMKMVRDGAIEAQAAQEAGEEPTAQQEQFLEIWTQNTASWDPNPEQFEETAAVMRGGYVGIFKHSGYELLILHLIMYPLLANWSIAAYMMLGMALFKAGVLQGRRSNRYYVVMAATGYGVGLTGAWLGMRYLSANFGDMIALMQGGMSAAELAGAMVAFGHIALVMLAVRHNWCGWLEVRLAAAGRMAFTNYLAQTVIGVTLFYGYGFGFYGTFSRTALLGVTVGVWVLQLAWSPWWLARFRFGPAEWLWRTLTYGKGQRLRREA